MHIRTATASDAPQLAAIALAAKATWGYSPAQLEAWRADLSPSVESLQMEPTFVAEVGGELAAFTQVKLGPPKAVLEHLWVHPRFMRQGIGRALLARAVAWATAHGVPTLWIDSEPHAEPFYRSHGAVRVGLRAAPIEGHPDRALPQMVLDATLFNETGT